MPHLDIFGLSEAFCLSDAGNCHWAQISKLTAKLPSEWRGSSGERAYASFLYTAIAYDRRQEVREDDTISIVCQPVALNAPFFLTETVFSKPGDVVVAKVRLLSTFSATDGQSNARFIKSSIPFQAEAFGKSEMEAVKQRFKDLSREDDAGFAKAQDHVVHPLLDFNAANFMYFVNYGNLFKRYEISDLSSTLPLATREIAYLGNVDPFEKITVFSRRDRASISSAMVRSSDRKCIARSLSATAPATSAGQHAPWLCVQGPARAVEFAT